MVLPQRSQGSCRIPFCHGEAIRGRALWLYIAICMDTFMSSWDIWMHSWLYHSSLGLRWWYARTRMIIIIPCTFSSSSFVFSSPAPFVGIHVLSSACIFLPSCLSQLSWFYFLSSSSVMIWNGLYLLRFFSLIFMKNGNMFPSCLLDVLLW